MNAYFDFPLFYYICGTRISTSENLYTRQPRPNPGGTAVTSNNPTPATSDTTFTFKDSKTSDIKCNVRQRVNRTVLVSISPNGACV